VEGNGEHSLEILAAEGERSPTVTCVLCDQPERVVRMLNERGFVIGAGHGELRRSAVRIGHMGDHTVAGLEVLLDVMAAVIRSMH
jgi:aspartate aminotransferase-like enzyme